MRSPLPRLAALAAAAGIGASCSLIHDLDGLATEPGATTSGGGAASSASSGGGGPGGAGSGGTGGVPPPPLEECKGGQGVCLPSIPSGGWAGYYSINTTAFGAGPSQCLDGSAPERAFAGQSTQPVDCSACTCGTPQIDCEAPYQAYTDNLCVLGETTLTLIDDCVVLGANVNGVIAGQPTFSDVECDPSGGVPAGASPPWATEHSLCGADPLAGGGCSGGDACVKKTDTMLCIKADGDIACPSGWEVAVKIAGYGGGTDERGCTACSCTPPGGALCEGGTYQFFNDIDCDGAADVSIAPGSGCTATPNANSAVYVASTDGVSCTPVGGNPTGSVVPGGAVTLCCR